MIIDQSWWKESGATSGVGMVLVVTLLVHGHWETVVHWPMEINPRARKMVHKQ